LFVDNSVDSVEKTDDLRGVEKFVCAESGLKKSNLRFGIFNKSYLSTAEKNCFRGLMQSRKRKERA